MGYLDESGQLRPSILANAKGLVSAISGWSEATQGFVAVATALDCLRSGLGAEMVVLSRHSRSEGVRLLLRARRALPPGTQRSFAQVILGDYAARPRLASVWLASQVYGVDGTALEQFQLRHRLADLAVIPIEVLPGRTDFIEFHFAAVVDRRIEATLEEVAPALARSWERRVKGLFAESVLSEGRASKMPGPAVPILADSNPVSLSRAEYRVCLMLSRGLSNVAVREELDISASTLKTHLRNIYAKTDCSSQTELIYRLLSHRLRPGEGRTMTA